MKKADFPILEFDPAQDAVINPHTIPKLPVSIPPRAIICYFREAIQTLLDQGRLTQVAVFPGEIIDLPIYQTTDPNPVVIIPGQLGSANAATYLERLYSNGVTKVIVIGGAGVLDPNLPVGNLIIPTAAIRDEGASHHYLPPSREVAMNPHALNTILATLTAQNIPHLLGKTWTTDAFFRETHAKVKQRRAEGALTVEMEAATYFAVAQFRNIHLGQILYAGDDVSGTHWDKRNWTDRKDVRSLLLETSLTICRNL